VVELDRVNAQAALGLGASFAPIEEPFLSIRAGEDGNMAVKEDRRLFLIWLPEVVRHCGANPVGEVVK
jgi:hypothetical protein